MIIGVVNAGEATVRFPIRANNGSEHEIDAVLDTGFNGSLTLPQAIISSLGLPWRGHATVILANGAQEQCNVYAATIVWDDTSRKIIVQAADTTPLLGMALLHQHHVDLDVIDGGRVTIQRLS